MNIQDFLNKLKNAVLGSEVKMAIHDAIKKAYEDAAEQGNANMEVEMARGTEPTLNDRLGKMDDKDEEVTAQLAHKRDKTVKINTADLDISSESAKIQSINLSDEVKQQMAGTTSINASVGNDGINLDKIAPQSIDYMKHSKQIPLVFKDKPRNLFDKNAVTTDYYVKYSNGELVANSSYTASDYMPVIGGLDYALHIADQHAWYDVDKVYITGVTAGGVRQAPVNAKYLRVSTQKSDLDIQMIEQSSAVGNYEPFFTDLKVEAIKYFKDGSIVENLFNDDVKDKLNPLMRIEKIINESLMNRSIKTKIKLIGDSIMAGAGGTGFNRDGEIIPGTTDDRINTSGYCFANELKGLIETKYNKPINVTATDPLIKYYVDYTFSGSYDASTVLSNFFLGGGSRKAVSVDFYGEAIDLKYLSFTDSGIVDIYIDGVKHGTIDAYDTSQTKTYAVTSLSLDNHTLEIYETATKNAEASGYKFRVNGFTLTKYASVINYGISGLRSDTALDIANDLLESDDDIVLMQVGTNDRHNTPEIEVFKRHMRKIIRIGYSINPNVKFILMSASPTMSDNDTSKYYGMFEVDKAIKELALELNAEYLSNYDGVLKYVEYRNILVDDLMDDGLHPNDLGHKVMFKNIARGLGVPFVADGVTK